MQFIDLHRQYLAYKSSIDQAIQEVLDSSQYIMGPAVEKLEAMLAEYVGVSHCITVGSGTEALQIALMAQGIGPGDEVITTPFTFIATAEAVRLVGAKPVFVDIDADTYNMAVDQIEAVITPKTKAILPVSLFGQMPDYAAINQFGIPVIEDAAQSFGATQNGRCSGSVTLLSVTSFFPAKPLGCYGNGGALFTDDDELAGRIRAVRTHGGEERHHYVRVGMNGRFDTIQAAVMTAKFPHFPKEMEARARIGVRYTELLSECCKTPKVAEGNTHIYAQYTISCEGRDSVAEHLREKGIPTAVYYPRCLHRQEVFADLGYGEGDFPVAEASASRVLSLPMHPFLTNEEQDTIVDAVKEALLINV